MEIWHTRATVRADVTGVWVGYRQTRDPYVSPRALFCFHRKVEF